MTLTTPFWLAVGLLIDFSCSRHRPEFALASKLVP